jgi:hypothetical protein
MPLPTTRFALSYVGTAGNQGPHFAACTDPKVRDLFRCGQFGQRSVRTHDVPHLQRRDFPDFLQAPLAPTNPSNSRKSTSDLLPDHKTHGQSRSRRASRHASNDIPRSFSPGGCRAPRHYRAQYPGDPCRTGSGASREFGSAKAAWRIEDSRAANPECLISNRFPSLTRVTFGASAVERRLLSTDAPELIPARSLESSSDFKISISYRAESSLNSARAIRSTFKSTFLG